MIPNPRMKIKAIHIGAIYFKLNMSNPNVRTLMLPLLVISSRKRLRSSTHPANIDINIPPNGSKILDETKSKNTKRLILNSPKKFNPFSHPNDIAHSVPNIIAIAVFRRVAFLRSIFFSSVKNAIDTSLIEIVEVIEVMNSRKKNSDDHIALPGS